MALCREQGRISEQLKSLSLPGAGRIIVAGLSEVGASAAGSLGLVDVKGVLGRVSSGAGCLGDGGVEGENHPPGGRPEEEPRSLKDPDSGTGEH